MRDSTPEKSFDENDHMFDIARLTQATIAREFIKTAR
jgi:hypothetical protein